MPSETYDNVWAKGGPLTVASQYLTSDQCLGCHSAGGTGLQFDMTEPGTGRQAHQQFALRHVERLADGARRAATRSFSPSSRARPRPSIQRRAKQIEDTCFGCHGIQGQRQAAIDRRLQRQTAATFARTTVDATPYPPDDPVSRLANYGALARDGVSCTACHRMVLGKDATARHGHEPQNACVLERQEALNPGLTGFAKSFTGSFLVGPPDKLYGPFQDPKKIPMQRAIGSDPAHSTHITTSEVCGSCHTVHLPVLHRGKTIGHTYEQTTYPEWAFSDYRTGTTPDGPLPLGRGARAQSCQDCHMPSKSADGTPLPQQDRVDPGIHATFRRPNRPCRPPRSTCRCAAA